MPPKANSLQSAVPSVDRLLKVPALKPCLERHGRQPVTDAIRSILAALREDIALRGEAALEGAGEAALVGRITSALEASSRSPLRRVFNLTGTILHTNLGRATLPQEAIAAMTEAAANPVNLEYDLDSGRRGDRDRHVEAALCRLTGAEAATVVNNNAAAVLLVLNTLALRKEVPVSRGELIEIGGSFRIPDIMARAGCKLVEVGTTNRTHLKDYVSAMRKKTALVMKVHTSNYVIEGFTASAPEKELAEAAHENGIPLVVDLGSGTLVDVSRFGLSYEATPKDTLQNGADLVTFSGDKVLGGPQAGIIAGRRDLIAKIKRNPMKRALRLDKVSIAALAAVLHLYADPDRLAERVPTLRHAARDPADIKDIARQLQPDLSEAVKGRAEVDVVASNSQIGSGASPGATIPSFALRLKPIVGRRRYGRALKKISDDFRSLPIPVIGRIEDDAYWLDLRCLDDEDTFREQLVHLPRVGKKQ